MAALSQLITAQAMTERAAGSHQTNQFGGAEAEATARLPPDAPPPNPKVKQMAKTKEWELYPVLTEREEKLLEACRRLMDCIAKLPTVFAEGNSDDYVDQCACAMQDGESAIEALSHKYTPSA